MLISINKCYNKRLMRQLNSMKWNRAVISILRNSDLYPLYTKDSIFSPVRTAPHPAATQEVEEEL